MAGTEAAPAAGAAPADRRPVDRQAGDPQAGAPRLAPPARPREAEYERDRARFDALAYLAVHPDLRDELGLDLDGAWRHFAAFGAVQDRAAPGLRRAAPRRVDPARAMARPFGIDLLGPFDAPSGLGTAARNLRAAVAAAGIPHRSWPLDAATGHLRLSAETADAFARAPRHRINLVLANADQIRHVAGLLPDGALDDAYTIAVWAWELAAFRPDFEASFALVDEVWTNSRFERDAIAAAAPVPVHLVPLPVPAPPPDPEGLLRRDARRRFGLADGCFAFLCPFDAGSTAARKNPGAAIAAFRAAFGDERRTRLIVKFHGADAALGRAIAGAIGDAPNIEVIDRLLDPEEMAALQRAADALVSAHRSEGFGLNLAEFAAAGKPVVATDYSGSRDFLEPGHDRPVAARLVELDRRAGPYLPHAVWAEPDHAALVRALREIRRAGPSPSREAARAARFGAAFGTAAIGARIAARIAALGLADRLPPRTGDTSAPPPPRPPAGPDDPIASPARLPPRADDTAPAAPPPPCPPDGPDGAIAWPARLPTLGVVLVDDGRHDRDALLAALARQSWPFLEVLLVRDALPPAEDAPARAALRPGPLPIRLVEAAGADPLPRAAEAASGAWLAIPEPGALPDRDALLEVARALDRDDAPPRATLAVPGGTLIVLRKTEALAAASPPPAPPPPDPAAGAALAALRGLAEPGADRLALPGGGESLRVLAASLAPARLAGLLVDLGGPAPVLVTAGGVRPAPVPPPAGPVAIPRRDPRALPPMPPPEAHRALVAASGLLDARHYSISAPDVAAAGIDPVAHYCEYGWREHRSPNFYFDPVFYRARYMGADPDEALDPLLHWLDRRWSGVRPSPLFDPGWVRRSLGTGPGVDPLAAYLARRETEDVAPLPEFDPAFYRARRRDVAYLRVDPFEHYMRFGAREGLNPSAEFDTTYYAAHHMRAVDRHDPIAANPLLHYLERRETHPVVTSRAAALRQQLGRLRLLGADTIDLAFCWYDGLPQRIEFLRAWLAEPSLAMRFRVVLANEAAAAAAAGDARLLAALRLPYGDAFDDRDIADRLLECFADPRCARRDGRPVLGVIGGAMPGAAMAFAERLVDLMRRLHSVTPTVERVDRGSPAAAPAAGRGDG